MGMNGRLAERWAALHQKLGGTVRARGTGRQPAVQDRGLRVHAARRGLWRLFQTRPLAGLASRRNDK